MNVLDTSSAVMRDVLYPDRSKAGPKPGPAVSAAELSFAQQRLWFLDQVNPGRPTYVIPQAIELNGSLNAPALEKSLYALICRHESLRTIITPVEGEPWQVVFEAGRWMLPVTNLSAETDPRAQLNRLLRQELNRGFDLSKGPPFRAQLYRLTESCHVLLLVMHHVVSDGWSMGILIRELGELYTCLCRGEAAALPPVGRPYRDFAQWQRDWLQGAVLEKLLGHWRERLAGAPQVLDLPTDRPRPTVESNRGAAYSFMLPPKQLQTLRRFAAGEKTTLFMALLAGFAALLWRYSGQEDLLIGSPVAGRNRKEIEGVVGCFVNTLVLRADLSGDPTARELLQRLRQVCLDAIQNQDLPFERLVEEMRPARDLGRNPLVQIMFSLENVPMPPLELPGLTQTPLDLDRTVTHVDLTLRARETDEGLRAYFEYSTDLFDEITIARMAAHWCSLLAVMAATPDRRISELSPLSEPEQRQLVVEWNETAAEYPRDSLVHDALEAQAERAPEAVAASFEGQQLKYGELTVRSRQIAHILSQRGIGAGARVGICVGRSLEMIIGMLGVLKTGAAYIPLDPLFPQDRLRFMAEDARLAAMLTTSAHASLIDLPRDRVVMLDTDADVIASAPGTRLEDNKLAAQPHDPAYVIYTSGSTGQPKGVIVPHRAVVNLLTSMAREPGLTARDVLVAVTTLSFDIAVLELLLPLMVGAKVVIASQDQTLNGHALANLLEQQQATVMQATPVTWRLLLEAGWKPNRPFKCLVGGESLPKDLAEHLLAQGVELWNMYGPTETTVWSTCAHIGHADNSKSIGKPIANTTIRILDAQNNLCPAGVPGELLIGGDGLSLGYWNRPDLTAKRFVDDPFNAKPGVKLYRTGDHARWCNDGTIEHLGRLDNQIKLRGFRIEPGEIEAVIARHPSVHETAVVAREDKPGDKRLVAYLVFQGAPPAGWNAKLRTLLRAALPEYMVPAHFVTLPALPRTPNGKLDRPALPPPMLQDESPGRIETVRSGMEKLVLDTFRSILDRRDFGVSDSFFDLGGHSLMAARLMVKLRAASGLDVPMRLLFEYPTPAGLAEALEGLAWQQDAKAEGKVAQAGQREEIEM